MKCTGLHRVYIMKNNEKTTVCLQSLCGRNVVSVSRGDTEDGRSSAALGHVARTFHECGGIVNELTTTDGLEQSAINLGDGRRYSRQQRRYRRNIRSNTQYQRWCSQRKHTPGHTSQQCSRWKSIAGQGEVDHCRLR